MVKILLKNTNEAGGNLRGKMGHGDLVGYHHHLYSNQCYQYYWHHLWRVVAQSEIEMGEFLTALQHMDFVLHQSSARYDNPLV